MVFQTDSVHAEYLGLLKS
jgi:hypothetical protein